MSKKKKGYKNPPKEYQFKKGQSGNPAGRPKGTQNMGAILENEFAEIVIIKDKRSGIEHKVSKLEALMKQLVNQAASDPRALKLLIQLYREIKGKDLATKEILPWTDDDGDFEPKN